MEKILQNVQNKLSEINGLKYIDENWGQLDYYSPNMPVMWPCCLIDINDGDFSNLGKDLGKKPKERQMGNFALKIILANLKLGNTSQRAPQLQKNNGWLIWKLMQSVHEKLHGFTPGENCSKLIRRSFQRTLRDDGVQEYHITYLFEARNV